MVKRFNTWKEKKIKEGGIGKRRFSLRPRQQKLVRAAKLEDEKETATLVRKGMMGLVTC